jgi:hypothetical protein
VFEPSRFQIRLMTFASPISYFYFFYILHIWRMSDFISRILALHLLLLLDSAIGCLAFKRRTIVLALCLSQHLVLHYQRHVPFHHGLKSSSSKIAVRKTTGASQKRSGTEDFKAACGQWAMVTSFDRIAGNNMRKNWENWLGVYTLDVLRFAMLYTPDSRFS